LASPLAQLEGKYEILEKIREGGMGAVYKVRHRLLDEVRVVKVMRPHLAKDEVLQARFLREAKVAIKLHHPNLAQIYDFTVDESGYAYLVMEFIDGLNLQEVIKVLDRPGFGLVLEIARQSLDALGYLHRKRIIHRDVSPDNLLLTRDDEGALQVKLIDLGIAKVRGGDDNLTSEGTFLGKVRYSSPEHFKTQEGSDVGAASDLYSFGVVLYEMLTGSYPIKGTSIASLISGHLMHPPLDFAESDPEGRVPDDLRAVVRKALEKNPENRFGSSTSFADALQPWIEENPLDEDEFQAIFDLPTLTTHKIRTIKPGSTQSRIDQSFGLSTTPPPGDASDGDAEFENSGTVETGSAGRAQAEKRSDSQQAQIRALLAGAGKLAEAEHFAEARMQLASVLELDTENAEAQELLKAVEEADVELQKKRYEAAESVRLLVRAESYDRAMTQLNKAVREFGRAEIFDDLRNTIEAARAAYEERLQKVNEIIQESAKLMEAEIYDQSVTLLREGLDLDHGNRVMIAQLEEAEKGLEALLNARRREKEIEKAAATITQHLDDRDVDQAEHALALAHKLYGAETLFADLSNQLAELRRKLKEEMADTLRGSAQTHIENEDFAKAIAVLEEALQLAPDAAVTVDLLEAAKEGLRLEEKARERLATIQDRALKIDRLVAAGRLESAMRLIRATVKELGAFDQAAGLRTRVEEAIAATEGAVKKAGALLEQALEHAGSDSFSKANDILDEVRSLQEAGYPQIAELVSDAQKEVNRRIEAYRRQMTIDNVVQSVERQLDQGSIEEAHRELGVARRLYGDTDVLGELSARIDARARELRREEIAELIKSSQKKKRAPEDAVADLEAALSIDPHCEKATRLLIETTSARKLASETNLAKECEAVLATIDELIADGELSTALELLNATVEEAGDFRVARDLRRRLEELI
jgi:serine/threonine protein kinase